MSDTIIPYLSYAPVVLVVLVGVYCFRLRRNLKQTTEMFENLQKELLNEVQGVSHGSMGVGRKVLDMEQQVIALDSKLEELQRNDPAKVSYSEAAKLVELGADVEDLMECCGVSRPEAELVTALTKSKQAKEEQKVPTLTPEF